MRPSIFTSRGLFDEDQSTEEPNVQTVEPEPVLEPDMQQLYDHAITIDPSLSEKNAQTLKHVLAHHDVISVVRFVQRSKLAEWFMENAHLYLSVPASSYNPRLSEQHHDCHTHGLIVHYARMYATIMRSFQQGTVEPPPRCSLDEALTGLWLHDGGKIFTYVRIGFTNWWTYRQLPEQKDQAELLTDALYERRIYLDPGERRLLDFQISAKAQTMRIGPRDDRTFLIRRADQEAVRASESVPWTGAVHECPNKDCMSELSLYIPADLGRGALYPEPAYKCPRSAHKTRCASSKSTKEYEPAESQQFLQKLRIILPLATHAEQTPRTSA